MPNLIIKVKLLMLLEAQELCWIKGKVIQQTTFSKSCVFICLSGANSKSQKPPFTQDGSLLSLWVLLGMNSVVSVGAFLQAAENFGPDSAARLGVLLK